MAHASSPARAVAGAALACLVASCGPRASSEGDARLGARIDTLVAEAMADGKVPGLAISIVRGDSLIHSRGYGLADLGTQRAMTDTTPVVIGSTSKTITAAAIMQLVDAGRVALDTSITRYVAMLGAPPAAGAARPADPRLARISVRHLLTNVSGIPSGFSGDPYDRVDTAAGALARLVRDDVLPRPLDFEPGAGYRYSNRGFSVASLVVQDVSGQLYEDYIAEHLFAPLGMRHSTGRFWEGSARGMVQGYRESVDGTPIALPASLGREWTGSGMILSTSRDAARFLQALLSSGAAPGGDAILSPAATTELLRPQQPAESELGGAVLYALGWEVTELEGVTLVMKGGSVGTMGSLFVLLPQHRTGIVMVFNAIDYGKVQLLQNLVRLLVGAPTQPYRVTPAEAPAAPPATVALAPERLAALSGRWDTRWGNLYLSVRGDSLAARYEGTDLTLLPVADTAFVMRSRVREQDGTSLVIKPCGTTLCLWMRGDSAGVKR